MVMVQPLEVTFLSDIESSSRVRVSECLRVVDAHKLEIDIVKDHV